MLAASCLFDSGSISMPPTTQQLPTQAAAEVAEKVMRRIEISKVARDLQHCLEFASFKAQHGWENRTLRSIEPEVTETILRRKRPCPEGEDVNTTRSYLDSRKRVRAISASGLDRPSQASSWRHEHRLAQSSPIDHTATFDAAYPTLHDSPMFDAPAASSDDEDEDLPIPRILEPSSSIVSSSPPRTPPPARRLPPSSKHQGADLLLYLANSPRSPAVHVTRLTSASKDIPSTPPAQHSHLPSSVMQTPGTNLGLFNGALQTPGQNFNFADFCNVTPSPAQPPWGGRTPGLSKTPRLARRGLNFDTILPPTDSPSTGRRSTAVHGLALQLGDELERRA